MFAIAQDLWMNLSVVELFPVVVQGNNKVQACHARPTTGDGGVSNSPPTSYITPFFKVVMNQANTDSDSPAR